MDELTATVSKISDASVSAVTTLTLMTDTIHVVWRGQPNDPCQVPVEYRADLDKGWCTMVKGRAIPASNLLHCSSLAPASPVPEPRRSIVGTRSAADKTNLASARPMQHRIFVGKLNKETNEDSVKEFLEENGIEGAKIRRLEAKNWQEKNCSVSSGGAVCDEGQTVVPRFLIIC